MAVKQRLFPSPDQIEVLTMHVSHERFLFNLAVEQFNFAFRYRGPNRQRTMWPNNRERNRELTELRSESEWLRCGSQTVQQQALRVRYPARTESGDVRGVCPIRSRSSYKSAVRCLRPYRHQEPREPSGLRMSGLRASSAR